MVVFKMRDSVPSARYSSICNVLRRWRIWLIPTYRVYRLYDIYISQQEMYLHNNLNSHAGLCSYAEVLKLITFLNLAIIYETELFSYTCTFVDLLTEC